MHKDRMPWHAQRELCNLAYEESKITAYKREDKEI